MSESESKHASEIRDEVLNLLEQEQEMTPTSRRVIERYMTTWGCDVLTALTETHLLTENKLAKTLARGYGLPFVQGLMNYTLEPSSVLALPFSEARSWEAIIVLHPTEGPYLVVANPARTDRIEKLAQNFPLGFTLSVGERNDIVRAIDELYPLAAQLPSLHAE